MKLKILDLSRVLAGPLCSMILGDLGADVIKVERKGSGDETRGWGPPFNGDGESAYFLSVNRNKKSIALDLSEPNDRRVVENLAAEADVVVENFVDGSLGRLGLDPERLLEENPSLIWCTISGFGPESTRPGYDFVVQAECGWMAITGERAGQPMKVGVALADVVAGKDAAIAILAAVIERTSGTLAGDRRRIRISLADSARASLVNVAQNVLVSGQDANRWGNAHPNLVPYQLFEADRSFVIAVGSDDQWRACATSLGLTDLAKDPALSTNAGRVMHREALVSALSARAREMDAGYWIARLSSAGVPCGLVKSVAEALDGAGGSPLTGVPPSVPGSVRLPPPRLDEHGDSLRAEGWRAFQP
jgi:crotonobetainyl-CoA:carnitine CoA-transferase CaiB-like acyl-CoA transferase